MKQPGADAIQNMSFLKRAIDNRDIFNLHYDHFDFINCGRDFMSSDNRNRN